MEIEKIDADDFRRHSAWWVGSVSKMRRQMASGGIFNIMIISWDFCALNSLKQGFLVRPQGQPSVYAHNLTFPRSLCLSPSLFCLNGIHFWDYVPSSRGVGAATHSIFRELSLHQPGFVRQDFSRLWTWKKSLILKNFQFFINFNRKKFLGNFLLQPINCRTHPTRAASKLWSMKEYKTI